MKDRLEELTHEELVHEVRELRRAQRLALGPNGEHDPQRLIHDLQVRQIELELQNHELRVTQEALEESRSRYADLYDWAPVGYCTLDPEGHIREINLTGATLLGHPRGELIGRTLASFVAGRDRAACAGHVRRVCERKTEIATELSFAIGAREPIVLQLVSTPSRDLEGALALRTMLIDISGQKRLEGRLRLLAEAGDRLSSSLDEPTMLAAVAHLAVPALADVCVIDMLEPGREPIAGEGTIRRTEVVFADEALQAQLADQFKAHPPRTGCKTPQTRVIETGSSMLLAEVPSFDEALAHDPQEARILQISGIRSLMVVPISVRGRVLGALTLARIQHGRSYEPSDLRFAEELARRVATATDNARLYAQAQHAIQSREAVLALVSHDLRNPLGVILMRTAYMLERPVDGDRRTQSRRALESVYRSASRMNRLLGDLLDVSSIEADRLSIEREPQSAAVLLGDSLEMLQPSASAKGIQLETSFTGSHDFEVACDRERILQVFENLIGNAIKFTPVGGSISLGARGGDGEGQFSVSNTGPGIPPDELSHVFDRFWQARRTARLGTGLGLSIAKGIVEAHGGRIWAESPPGLGTTFVFTLPTRLTTVAEPPLLGDPRADALRARPEGEPVQEARKLVLVVDDDPDAQDAMRETLEHEGFAVASASNGQEALDYLRGSSRPFVVLLDLTMPIMDGWGFLAVREQDPLLRSIPVLVISDQRDVAPAVANAHASFVAKPVSPARLIETMIHVAP